jgi:hypothetical protein
LFLKTGSNIIASLFPSWLISGAKTGVICGYHILSLLPRAPLSGANPQLRISEQSFTASIAEVKRFVNSSLQAAALMTQWDSSS